MLVLGLLFIVAGIMIIQRKQFNIKGLRITTEGGLTGPRAMLIGAALALAGAAMVYYGITTMTGVS